MVSPTPARKSISGLIAEVHSSGLEDLIESILMDFSYKKSELIRRWTQLDCFCCTEKQYWKDLWNYRELFYFLAWRDILVRYKQTAISVAWALIQPFLTMVVFTVVFGQLAKLPSQGVPYPILVFAAMLPWQFFANSLSGCSNSLISNANLISKVYFPRLIVSHPQ